jgi:hypothetical protein
LSSPAWLVQERVHSHGRYQRKLAFPLSISTSTVGIPAGARVPEDEFLETQGALLAGEKWIVDSNDVDDNLLFERADTLVVIATRWWICAWRAFRRGLRRPRDAQLPEGCDESVSQRIGDEWGIVWHNWWGRKSVRERDLRLLRSARPRPSEKSLGLRANGLVHTPSFYPG